MRGLVFSELRAAWTSWLAVLIAFIVTSFAIVLAVLAIDSLLATIATGNIPESEGPALIFLPAWNLALAIVGTLSVIGAVTGLVVQARRGALARLSLAGATPKQVSRILLGQLAIVALAGSVVGVVIAILVQPAAIAQAVGERGVSGDFAVLRVDPVLVLVGAGGFVLFALLAGLRQSKVAAAVPPVEALRTIPGAAARGRQIFRWIAAVLLAFAMVGVAGGAIAAAPEMGVDGGDTVMQAAVGCILITSVVLSLAAPLTIGLFTRAWTALVPARSASWVIARAAVLARGERLSRTVTPIAMAVGLIVGLQAIVGSVIAVLEQLQRDQIEHAGTGAVLGLIGLVLLISISGGVSVVLIMSRQREAELALVGVVGATRRQQVLVPVFEGLIVTVTAMILGLIMTAVGVAVFVIGTDALDIGATAPIVVPWMELGVVTLLCAVIVIAATTLPVLKSLDKPARQVIAQLAAE
ncbi:FtsX-like permease family protein [Tessaracoccus caeni]|uniref:FtsX-like permease family protein n=1 Tax=Tessaracoccus caeni TaxID=3031239 RepID=UPI0029E8100D|nr:FtsX-like permease family protein [Tessaracoccus caeni]